MKKYNNAIKIVLTFIIILMTLNIIIKGVNSYREYKIESKNISNNISEISLDEVDYVVREFGDKGFIYINTENQFSDSFEKELIKKVKRNNLVDNFFYINASKIYKEDYLKEINDSFCETKVKIKNLPVVLYFEENNLIETVDVNVNDYKESIEDLTKLFKDK